MSSEKKVWLLAFMLLSFSCQTQSSSRIKNVTSNYELDHPIHPFPLRENQVAKVRESFIRVASNGENLHPCVAIDNPLANVVRRYKGVPREQIENIVKEVVEGKVVKCPKKSCTEIFGLSPQNVGEHLNNLKTRVVEEPKLDPNARELLLKSLNDKPEWLDYEDFKSFTHKDKLTVRKPNYDLIAERDAFKACDECKFAINLGEIRQMILESSQAKPCLYAVRTDGTVVFARGPEMSVKHGFLASLNPREDSLISPGTSPQDFGTVLLAGEAYMSQGKFIVNNKSGHYRPEFERLNNPSALRLFEGIKPSEATELELEQSAKTRSDIGYRIFDGTWKLVTDL